jgi:hypothetical protein
MHSSAADKARSRGFPASPGCTADAVRCRVRWACGGSSRVVSRRMAAAPSGCWPARQLRRPVSCAGLPWRRARSRAQVAVIRYRDRRRGRAARRSESPSQALRAHRGLGSASRTPRSLHRRGVEAQVSIQGGSRTTWERGATSQNAMLVVVDGAWPLPPRGPRSLLSAPRRGRQLVRAMRCFDNLGVPNWAAPVRAACTPDICCRDVEAGPDGPNMNPAGIGVPESRRW